MSRADRRYGLYSSLKPEASGPISRTWQHLRRMAGSRSTLILQIPTRGKRTTTLISLSAQWSAGPHGHACRKVPTVGIAKVYEVDPMICDHCGSPMRILATITDPQEVKKIPVRDIL